MMARVIERSTIKGDRAVKYLKGSGIREADYTLFPLPPRARAKRLWMKGEHAAALDQFRTLLHLNLGTSTCHRQLLNVSAFIEDEVTFAMLLEVLPLESGATESK